MDYKDVLKTVLGLIVRVGRIYYEYDNGRGTKAQFEESFALLVKFAMDKEKEL